MARIHLTSLDNELLLLSLTKLYGQEKNDLTIGQLREVQNFFLESLKEGKSRPDALDSAIDSCASKNDALVFECNDIVNLATEIDKAMNRQKISFRETWFFLILLALAVITVVEVTVHFIR